MAIKNAASVFLHEEGINNIIKHFMKKRPSMFNFGTSRLNTRKDLLCFQPPIDTNLDPNQPWITCIKPILITDYYGIDFCYQISDFEFDFNPTTSEPTNQNQFLIKGRVHVGIGVPELSMIEPYIQQALNEEEPPEPEKVPVIEVNKLDCFQLDLKATGHFIKQTLKEKKDPNNPSEPQKEFIYMVPKIDSLNFLEIEPETINKTAELFAYTALSTVKTKVEQLIKKIPKITGIHLFPSEDPKIINNELQLFLDAEVKP